MTKATFNKYCDRKKWVLTEEETEILSEIIGDLMGRGMDTGEKMIRYLTEDDGDEEEGEDNANALLGKKIKKYGFKRIINEYFVRGVLDGDVERVYLDNG